MPSDEIVSALKPEVLEVISSIGEISIDTILKDGLLKDIPIIGTLFSVYKMGVNIQNAIFIRNISTFLYELKKNKFSEISFDLLSKLESDEGYRIKVSDTILILNAKFNSQKKAKIHACILLALAENKIDIKEFELIRNFSI